MLATVTRSQVLGFRVRAVGPVHVELWAKASASRREAITEQAERLAAYRHAALSGIDIND